MVIKFSKGVSIFFRFRNSKFRKWPKIVKNVVWICSFGELDLIFKGRVLSDGLKSTYQNTLKEGQFLSFSKFKTSKMAKNSQKWSKIAKKENFRPKFLNFFSESNQNVSKRILNRKNRFQKIFSVQNFSLGLPFFDENGYIVKIFDQNFWFFFQNRFTMFQNVF